MSARITEAMRDAAANILAQADGCQYVFARHFDLAEMVLAAALSTEPGEADPFEHCAREAEAQAELVEQMRGVYPGDPHGALGRDANKMRRLAKSIRQLRPAAHLPEDTHHG